MAQSTAYSTTMANPITTEISTPVLIYEPGGDPARFQVMVDNNSDRFAAFRLELSAAGSEGSSKAQWYCLTPDVSSKIPAGDRTRFQVEILAVPPVPDGFTGTMNLTVRVYSIELQAEDRQVMRLVVKGTGYLPPRLTLTLPKLQGYPGDRVEIPVAVANPNRQSVDVILRLADLSSAWLPDGTEKHLHILAKGEKETCFICQIPAPSQAASQRYPFVLTASQPQAAVSSQVQGQLFVLPAGFVELHCQPRRQTLPMQPRRWLNPAVGEAIFDLALVNQSNLPQQTHLTAQYENPRDAPRPRRWPWQRLTPNPSTPNPSTPHPFTPTLPSPIVDLEVGDRTSVPLTVRRRLPWLGWPRVKRLQIQASLAEARLDLRQDSQTVELEIRPLIPGWLQLLAALLALGMLGLAVGLLWRQAHWGTVSAVQFNGQADEVVSVGKDGHIRLWEIRGGRLIPGPVLNRNDDRAIRVVRYRPVANDQVMVGFENGAIEAWNLLLRTPQAALSYRNDDRVFDLTLTQDARSLFSGHGSGLVLEWNLDEAIGETEQPLRGLDMGFAVQALTLVGAREEVLAIAGRNNQLVLVNRQTEASQPLAYRNGGGNDYIISLATPGDRPMLLAAADNQGYISLWNLQPCLTQANGSCELLDEWSTGHNGETVRAIAFTTDGCYLASAGDDGRARLWPLTDQGRRLPAAIEGRVVRREVTALSAVDVIRTRQRLQVVSGADSGEVRLNRLRLRDGADDDGLANGRCRGI